MRNLHMGDTSKVFVAALGPVNNISSTVATYKKETEKPHSRSTCQQKLGFQGVVFCSLLGLYDLFSTFCHLKKP